MASFVCDVILLGLFDCAGPGRIPRHWIRAQHIVIVDRCDAVEGLRIGFLDFVFPPSRAVPYAIFLNNCGTGLGLVTATC